MSKLYMHQIAVFTLTLIVKVLFEALNKSFFHLAPQRTLILSYGIYVFSFLCLVYLYKKYSHFSFQKKVTSSIYSFVLSVFVISLALSFLRAVA